MTSNRPYLLRALFDWICDNGATPYVLVDANVPGVQVPLEHVADGKIVLNISPNAVRSLVIGDDLLSFDARFSGSEVALAMPIAAVRAIFARETQEGMTFPEEPADSVKGEPLAEESISEKIELADKPKTLATPSKVSHLKVIK